MRAHLMKPSRRTIVVGGRWKEIRGTPKVGTSHTFPVGPPQNGRPAPALIGGSRPVDREAAADTNDMGPVVLGW